MKYNGGKYCIADSIIEGYKTEDETGERNTLDFSPNSRFFKEKMNNKLGDMENNLLDNQMNLLNSLVDCNSFKEIKNLILSDNNLKDSDFEFINEKFNNFLNNSFIESIDIRNNNILEETITKNSNIKNKNGNLITITSDYGVYNENNINIIDENNDNISIFIPEIVFDKLTNFIIDRRNRKSRLDELLVNIANIKFNNNLSNDLSEKNIEEKNQKPAGLLGLGGYLYLGGLNDNNNETALMPDSNSGIKLVIPKHTFNSFLNIYDKSNRTDNINTFISSLNDIQISNEFKSKKNKSNDRLLYFSRKYNAGKRVKNQKYTKKSKIHKKPNNP